MARATVAISDDFLSAFVKLPRKEQAKTSEFISKFRSNPESPGIHYEKSGAAWMIRSVRSVLTWSIGGSLSGRQARTPIFCFGWIIMTRPIAGRLGRSVW